MDNEPKDLIEKEINFIEQSIISKEFADKIIFLANRLYNNFKSDKIVYEKSDFLNIFGNEQLHKVIMPKLKILENLYIQYSENNLVNFSSNNIVLLNNKQYLSLSPFFYSEKLLKDIITHELSILDLNERENIIKKAICVFDELKIRIGLPFSWDAINEKYRHYQLFEEVEVWQEEDFDYETKELMLITCAQTVYGDFEDQYLEAGFLGVQEREVIDLNELINWLEKTDFKKIKKIKQIEQKKLVFILSPFKLYQLILVFFEENKTETTEKQKQQIKFFINNFIEIDKRFTLTSIADQTIDFFTKDSFKSFVALLIYLDKKSYLETGTNMNLYNILKNEFKGLKVGLSNRLREDIGNLKKLKEELELIKVTKFKKAEATEMILNN